MADCCNMKQGNLYVCNACGLELKVEKACTCTPNGEGGCTNPLTCCEKEMTPAKQD